MPEKMTNYERKCFRFQVIISAETFEFLTNSGNICNSQKLSPLSSSLAVESGRYLRHKCKIIAFVSAIVAPCHLLLLFCSLVIISSALPLHPRAACGESSYYRSDVSE